MSPPAVDYGFMRFWALAIAPCYLLGSQCRARRRMAILTTVLTELI